MYIYILYFFVCSILKHQLNTNILGKKLLNSLEFFFVQCQGYKNYCKVVKGVRKLFKLFLVLL